MTKIELWIDEGCWACHSAIEYLKKFRIPYTAKVLGRDFLIPEALERFPQFKNDNALLGVQFPIVLEDGIPIGGLDVLIDKMGGNFRKN